MRALTLAAVVASFLLGLALIHGAPTRWRLDSWQGILLGTALYMGVVHRWLAWRRTATPVVGGDAAAGMHAAGRAAWGLTWRVAAFLGIVVGEAYAYFEWLPPSDMRAPFVMLSAWIVAETLLAPRAFGASVSAASPRV